MLVMDLFFHFTGGKLKEHEFQEEKWIEVKFGHHSVQLGNEFMRVMMAPRDGPPDMATMEEMTGCKGELEVVIVVWPVFSMALTQAQVKNWQAVEDLVLENGKLPPGNAFLYSLAGGDTTLWDNWLAGTLLPNYVRLGKSNAIGFRANVATTLQAATVEIALAAVFKQKKVFSLCKKHFQFYFDTCGLCQPDKAKREKFLLLLRQHKHLAKSKPSGEATEVIARIAEFQRAVKEGKSLNSIYQEYREFCQEYGLPIRWAKR